MRLPWRRESLARSGGRPGNRQETRSGSRPRSRRRRASPAGARSSAWSWRRGGTPETARHRAAWCRRCIRGLRLIPWSFFHWLQPGHHRAQVTPDLFYGVFRVLLSHGHELLAPVRVLVQPLLRKRAVLDLAQDLAHVLAHVVVDHARAGNVVAVLGRVRDRVAHETETAAIHEVDDELQLVEDLEVRELGLVAGLDQGLETGLDQRADTAAKHRLLAEEVGLGLFLECGLEHAGPPGAQRPGVRERARPRLAGGVLVHRDQGGYALALEVRAAHQVTGALRGDHRDVELRVGLDLREVDGKPVHEHQHRARLEVVLDRLAEQFALAAVADHRDRLTQAGWAVDFVVDLHALLLMTTGPERTTSWTPCLLNSSTKSPTSVPSPANSTVVPAG